MTQANLNNIDDKAALEIRDAIKRVCNDALRSKSETGFAFVAISGSSKHTKENLEIVRKGGFTIFKKIADHCSDKEWLDFIHYKEIPVIKLNANELEALKGGDFSIDFYVEWNKYKIRFSWQDIQDCFHELAKPIPIHYEK